MSLRLPLYLKIMTPLIILIALAVGLSGWRVYQQANDRLQRDLDSRLQRAISLTIEYMDIDQLQEIQVPSDLNSEAYFEIEDQLDLVRTSAGLMWVGLYRRDGDYLYYWVDVSGTGVGYPFFYATPNHIAAFETGQMQPVEYSDEFGSYYGFVAPLFDEDGNIIGLVEALAQQEARQLVQREALNSAASILIGGAVLAIAVSLVAMYFVFNRPMQRLHDGAERLAGGQFGYQIRQRSNDELGDLADTFNQMSTRIERLYLERVRDERARHEHEVAQLQESERLLEAKVAERTAQLVEARDHALEASSAKSAFLAHMSHELRTPLSVIIGYADILRLKAAEAGTPEPDGELTQIQASAQHILTLVNEVLDMSKIEAGKMTLYLEDIDVCALLTDVAATVEPLVQRNGNTLTVECTPGLGRIVADPTKIRQSLLNLISNASKFTHNGQIALWGARELSSNGRGDCITLSVSDTGKGIPPEKIGGLFEEYMQVGGPASSGGTGLGLAITRRFCTLMGGDITVSSELGKGSTFTIHLPARVEPK